MGQLLSNYTFGKKHEIKWMFNYVSNIANNKC